MLHRTTEVKFRDNQENRVQQFPKTPKNQSTQQLKFITPAPKSRVALGQKSTNVHNRQFTSIKTGKRHSPVTAHKPVFVLPEPSQELKGGDALRAAFQRALDNGDELPDVEYCPPKVQELPYESDLPHVSEDDIKAYIEIERLHRVVKPKPEEKLIPLKFVPLPEPRLPSVQSTRTARFAQPTASAQAKMKPAIKRPQPQKLDFPPIPDFIVNLDSDDDL